MENVTEVVVKTKTRDRAIDMAKGILIAMLIFHHIVDVSGQSGVANAVISAMRSVQKPLIVCYFMPAFFMITGICSNFDKPFLPFLKNQIKGLVIPAVSFILMFHIYQGDSLRHLCGTVMRLFLFGKDYWFLIALFEAKILFWFLNKYIKNVKVIIALLVIFSLMGACLNELDIVQNFFMHRHVLDLTLYLGVGHIMKATYKSRKVTGISLVIFVIVTLAYVISGEKMPYVTYTFGTTIGGWLPHVLLSVCGSLLILWLSRNIRVDSLIEYMGKNSLAIFLMQWYTLFMFIEMAAPILACCSIRESVAVIVSIFVSTIAIGLLVAYLGEHTKFKYLMGKF